MPFTEDTNSPISGPANNPDGLAFGPNGTYIAVGWSGDGLNIYDDETLSLQQTPLGHARYTAYSKDGSLVAALDGTDIVRFVDTSTWTELTNAAVQTTFYHSEVDFSYDSQYFAYIDPNFQTVVAEVGGDSTWTVAQTFSEPGSDSRALSWHPDGYLMITDRNGNIWLVDQSTLTVVDQMQAADSPLSDAYRCDVATTNPWFAVSDTDNVAVFNVSNDTITVEQSWLGAGAVPVAITDEYIVIHHGTGADDEVYETGTWNLSETISGLYGSWNLAFSADGSRFAASDRSNDVVYVYDVPTSGDTVTGNVQGTALDESSNPIEGATVRVLDEGADPSTHLTTATTNSNGAWGVDVTDGTTIEALLEYDDGSETAYSSHNKPYVAVGTQDTAPDPSAAWYFDEGSGSTLNDSIGTRDGTIQAGVTWVTDGTGYGGAYLDFAGTTDIVDLGSISPINTNGAFTVILWARIDAPFDGVSQSIFGYRFSGIWIHKSGSGDEVYARVNNNGSCVCVPTGAMVAGDWYMIAFSRDESGNTRGYYNGNGINSTSSTTDVLDDPASYQFGSVGGESWYLEGGLDYCLWYDHELTEQEVIDVYNDTAANYPGH